MIHPKVRLVRLLIGVSALLSLGAASRAAADASPASGSGSNEQRGTATSLPPAAFAAIGAQVVESNHLAELGWTEVQIAAFVDGVRAGFKGQSLPFDESAKQLSSDMARRIQEIMAREQAPGRTAAADPKRYDAALKTLRKRLGLQLADNGLAYRVELGRGGPRPQPGDSVVFTCVATAVDGTTRLPQLSVDHLSAKMQDLFPGFQQGFQMMTAESKAVFVLPPALSFGEKDWPPDLEPGMPIIFEVVLHGIVKPGSAP